MWGIPEDKLRPGEAQTALEFALEGVVDADVVRERITELFKDPLASGYDTLRFKDGRVFERFTCPQVVEGRSVGRVWSFRDMTARIQSEQERARLEATLRQAQKIESLGTLAGGIAHDFNNLLTGIFGALEMTGQILPAEHPAREFVDLAAGSAERARDLVRHILTFSRRHEGERKPAYLGPIVEEALRLLRSTLPAMVELRPRLAPKCPLVLADATQVHQVVMNLCTNAWHALPETGGRITVSVAPVEITPSQAASRPKVCAGPSVRVSVEDDGCGMSPEVAARVFEPFFTTKQTGKGTGLGLAVVHGIVESHGGLIELHTIPGQGTRFDVYFPAVATQTPGGAPALAAVRAPPAGQGEHLLWVDDDPTVVQVVALMLQALNYRVTHCSGPALALERFREDPDSFALVITDLAMPGMSGAALAAELLRLRPGLPVLVLSGFVQPEQIEDLLRRGVREVVRKPPSRAELAEAIARHLRPPAGAAAGPAA
jgi:signal transduction histidine kinase/CheY-like chemotaxis protein